MAGMTELGTTSWGIDRHAYEQLRWNLADHCITWRGKNICHLLCFFQVQAQFLPKHLHSLMQEAWNIFNTNRSWKIIVPVIAQKVPVGGVSVKIKILFFGKVQKKRSNLVFIAIVYSIEVFKYPLSWFYHLYICSSISLSLFDFSESNCVWKSI